MGFYKEEVEEVINAVYKVTGDINVAKVLQQVKDLPIQEERHGEWIDNGNGTWSCSLCQSWIPDEQHYYANYCLYCGANMKRRNEIRNNKRTI